MANSNLISKLNPGTGEKWIHDASSLHGISPATGDNATTFILQIGDPSSAYSNTVSLNMPSGVALKSDIQTVMKFAGTASNYSDLPVKASTGDTYVANGTFTVPAEKTGTSVDEKVEPGDMIIMGEDGKWSIVQTNIDPAKYALKGHTHTLSISHDTGSTSITPQGTVSVSITGRPTTFTGNFTPQGTISVGTFGYTSTDATISSTLAVINGAHTHSVNMSTSSIGVTYAKSNANTGSTSAAVSGSITASYTPEGTLTIDVGTEQETASLTGATSPAHNHSFTGTATTFSGSFTPAGTISVSISTASANADITNLSSPSHSHSFTGSSTTFTGSFTPAGIISKPNITPKLTSASVTYATGAKTLTSSNFTSISGALAYSTYSVNSETLTFTSHSAAAYSTKSYLTDVTLTTSSFTNITGITAELNAAPTFTGTAGTVTVSGTPKGTIGGSAVTFRGTVSYIKPTVASGTFYGKTGNISAFGTPNGTIGEKAVTIEGGSITYTKPTGKGEGAFHGITATITSDFNLTAASHSHTIGTTDTTVYGTMPSITISAASSTPQLGGGIKVTYDKLSSAAAKFTGTEGNISASGTPLLNAPVATFTGTASSHSHSFNSGTITTSTESSTEA